MNASLGVKNFFFPKSRLEAVFGCTDTTDCVISYSPGGESGTFLDAALTLPEDAFIRIDGMCGSACITFADYARPHVCVTERAVFKFHQGTSYDHAKKLGNFMPGHRSDITLWVYQSGGYPNTDKGEDYLEMEYPTTLRFWPKCPTQEALAKSDRLTVTPRLKTSTAKYK